MRGEDAWVETKVSDYYNSVHIKAVLRAADSSVDLGQDREDCRGYFRLFNIVVQLPPFNLM